MPAAASVLQTDVLISITKLRCCGFVIFRTKPRGPVEPPPASFRRRTAGQISRGPYFLDIRLVFAMIIGWESGAR